MDSLAFGVLIAVDLVACSLLYNASNDNSDKWDPENVRWSKGALDVLTTSWMRVLIAALGGFLCTKTTLASSLSALIVFFTGLYALVKLCAVHEVHENIYEVLLCSAAICFAIIHSAFVILRQKKAVIKVESNGYVQLENNMTGEEDQGASFKRVLSLAWPERYLLATALVCLFIASAGQMIVPTIFGRIINDISKSHNEQELDQSILFLVVLFVVSQAFASIRGFLFNLSGERLVARIRVRVFDAVLRQDIEFFDQNQTGELLSRLSNDTTVIQDAITTNISLGLRWMAQTVVGILILLALSWKLTLIMLSVVPLIAIGARRYGVFVRDLTKSYQDALGRAAESAEQSMSCIRTVRSFSKEDEQIREYERRIQVSYQHGKKRALAYGVFLGVVGLAAYLAIALVLWYGGRLVVLGETGDLDSAKLTSFLLYTVYIAVALGGLTGLFSQLMSAVGASERIFKLIDAKPKIPTNGELVDRSSSNPQNGCIKFQNVSFSYPTRRDVRVLENVSFQSSPGEITALVGPSGGGKSTIVSLILRFYDPDEGLILFDDMPLKNLDTFWLHSHLACVSQEPTLFATTIRENIKFGVHRDVSDEEIFNAAKQANAHDFITSFPDGYDTMVGERGVQLSGGQKQRVAIARAILVNPMVLLLDEATSALDSESEHLVQEALDRVMSTRTTIVIAHRLSTIRNADRILVINKGQLIESGTHDELIANKNSLYSALVKRQTDAQLD